MLSEKILCCIDWTLTIIPTNAYAYLDKKNKSLGHLDKNLQNQNNQVFLKKYNAIYRTKFNIDKKTQSFQI